MSPRIRMAVIRIAGTGGFLGLLIASHYWPAFATALRVAALVWFAGFGVAYAVHAARHPPHRDTRESR